MKKQAPEWRDTEAFSLAGNSGKLRELNCGKNGGAYEPQGVRESEAYE